MVFSGPKSYKESAQLLRAVINRFVEIKRRMGYSEKDARGQALEECRAIGNGSLMIVNIMSAGEESRVDLLQLIGFESGDIGLPRAILDEMARIYLVMMFQFKLETLWKNLLRELGVPNPSQGYYNMLQELFSRVPMPDQSSKFDTLQVPAMIRNSLHSNGFHYGYRGSSFQAQVDGLMFQFDHGKQVECAGWWHIIHALNAVAAIIDEILNAPAIMALPDPVYNNFTVPTN